MYYVGIRFVCPVYFAQLLQDYRPIYLKLGIRDDHYHNEERVCTNFFKYFFAYPQKPPSKIKVAM